METLQQLEVLFERVRVVVEGRRTSDEQLERPLLAVLAFIKQHPDQRADIAQMLIDLMKQPLFGQIEILEFTMAELKWPEVFAAGTSARNAATDSRDKRAWERVLAAYNPDWANRVIYDYYRCKDCPHAKR